MADDSIADGRRRSQRPNLDLEKVSETARNRATEFPTDEELKNPYYHPTLLEIRALPGFILWGRFADGSVLDWDIHAWIEDGTGEMIVPLKDFEYFKLVTINKDEGPSIYWPNGFDLDPASLYWEGRHKGTDEKK